MHDVKFALNITGQWVVFVERNIAHPLEELAGVANRIYPHLQDVRRKLPTGRVPRSWAATAPEAFRKYEQEHSDSTIWEMPTLVWNGDKWRCWKGYHEL